MTKSMQLPVEQTAEVNAFLASFDTNSLHIFLPSHLELTSVPAQGLDEKNISKTIILPEDGDQSLEECNRSLPVYITLSDEDSYSDDEHPETDTSTEKHEKACLPDGPEETNTPINEKAEQSKSNEKTSDIVVEDDGDEPSEGHNEIRNLLGDDQPSATKLKVVPDLTRLEESHRSTPRMEQIRLEEASDSAPEYISVFIYKW